MLNKVMNVSSNKAKTASGSTQAIRVGDDQAQVDGGNISVNCQTKTVTVPVYAMDSTNGLLELTYDSDLLTFVSAESGVTMTCVDASVPGLIRIGYADGAMIDAVIANLVFSVNSDEEQTAELVLTTLEDCDSTSVTAETVSLTVPGHSYVSEITKPTGDNQGFVTHTCVNCGHSFVDGCFSVIATGWSGYTNWSMTDTGVLIVSPTSQTLNGKCNMKNYWKVRGVLTLPWTAYADEIVEVIVEDGVHDLGQMAFYELPNLTTVTLGADVTEIRSYTFKNCVNLTTINLEGVDIIREGAFYGCSSLKDISLGENALVEDWAFTRSAVNFG